jgi:hypothetical protein
VTVTDLHNPGQLVVTVPELPNMSVGIGGQHSPCASFTPSPDGQFKKNVPEYSSFRIMKQKVSMRFTENNPSVLSVLATSIWSFSKTWPVTCSCLPVYLQWNFVRQSAVSDGAKVSPQH